MSKLLRIVLCGLLIVAFAGLAFADGRPAKRTDGSLASKIYAGGSNAADQTAGIVTGCFKRTFSLFNPCLDAIKGCTTLVLSPVEKPFDYAERAFEKCWYGKKAAQSCCEPRVPAKAPEQKKP
jgi:hypothetical protein